MASKREHKRRIYQELSTQQAIIEDPSISNIKVPRVQIPPEYQTELEPSFVLPKHLIIPPKLDRHKSQKVSYSELRRQREEMRKRLVIAAVNDADASVENLHDFDEKIIRRYYYYIRHGADTIHVQPLQQPVLHKVLSLIPYKLHQWRAILSELIEDMKEDYVLAVKKSIINFVLSDPNTFDTIDDENVTSDRKECEQLTITLKTQYDEVKKRIKNKLHVINPCIHALLDLYYKYFEQYRVIDCKKLKERRFPFELNDFIYTMTENIQRAGETLFTEYMKSVIDIFLEGNGKKLLPNPARIKTREHFYNCVNTIMRHHLSLMCKDSLIEFMNYIMDVKYQNLGFRIYIEERNNKLIFEPTFEEVKDALLNIIDETYKILSNIPILESRLYLDYQHDIINLELTLHQEFLKDCKREISKLIADQRQGPEMRIIDFKQYKNFYDGSWQI